MTKNVWLALLVGMIALLSCGSGEVEKSKPLTPEEIIAKNIDSLKRTATAGDLIVRLGDDMLSYQIKFLNEKDQSYSHAGMIVEKDNQKLVAHITPDDSTKDFIQYVPIDSFLNPVKNLEAALYRYNFSEAEKAQVNTKIAEYSNSAVHFDRSYDLATEDKLYCSEMISKVVSHATANRITFSHINAPLKMRPLLVKYFKGQHSEKTIATRQIMTIDNLYRVPECEKVMKIKLKHFPGQ